MVRPGSARAVVSVPPGQELLLAFSKAELIPVYWNEFGGGSAVVVDDNDRRLRSGAAVYLGGGLLDLGDCHHLGGQEAEHDADAAGNTATAIKPAPDASRTDAEHSGDAALRDTERDEHRTKFGLGHAGFHAVSIVEAIEDVGILPIRAGMTTMPGDTAAPLWQGFLDCWRAGLAAGTKRKPRHFASAAAPFEL